MFKTNGSTHHQGVKNEYATIDLLNKYGVYAEDVSHRGGTKQKADAVAGKKGISIKHKAGLKNGSFDWVNTSNVNAIIDRTCFDNFFTVLRGARQLPIEQREAIVEETRDLFTKCCEKALNSISSEALSKFLQTNITQKQRGYGIVINDTKHETLHIMEADRLIMTKCIDAGYPAKLMKGRGKSSRKLVFGGYEEGGIFDLGLRVRVTSNNGIKAFLGLSKANKSSQIVIKVQQDDIKEFVKTDLWRRILTYSA